MVRVTQIDASGNEQATVELDDFTVEILYSGIATMLREAASEESRAGQQKELSSAERQRRARILTRLNS
jgi:hypothetical protein